MQCHCVLVRACRWLVEAARWATTGVPPDRRPAECPALTAFKVRAAGVQPGRPTSPLELSGQLLGFGSALSRLSRTNGTVHPHLHGVWLLAGL